MKVRRGFVSNSSSSSFVINKRFLSKQQLQKIRNYEEEGKQFGLYKGSWDFWCIEENRDWIIGNTSMDNFDMGIFFEKIDVPLNEVRWGDGFERLPEEEESSNEDFSDEEGKTWCCCVCNERWTTYTERLVEECPFCTSTSFVRIYA